MKRLLLLVALSCAAGAAAAPMAADAWRQAEAAETKAARFREQAREASDAAARARAETEALIAEIEQAEAEITAATIGADRAERRLDALEAALADRRQPLAEMAASLQLLALRPPALSLLRPGGSDEMIRMRALLAAASPLIEEQSAPVRSAIAAQQRLSQQAEAERRQIAQARTRLAERLAQLATLERSRLDAAGAFADAALHEDERALALAERGRSEAAEAERQARAQGLLAALAALPTPQPRPGTAPARREPPYRLPVEGRVTRGTGELSSGGVHARAVTFATAADAPVVAPRAGRIAYAGRFRSYGEIVIIDHGGGWTSTITGLAALRIRRGDRVRAGDPVGRSTRSVGVELRRGGRPVPIAPFIVPS